jgi:hypothetical protein
MIGWNRIAIPSDHENLLVAYSLDRFPNRQVFPPAGKTVWRRLLIRPGKAPPSRRRGA